MYIISCQTQIVNPNSADTNILALKNTSEIVGNILSCNTSLQQIVAARFKILKSNGSHIFSPTIPYNGTQPISYSFGLTKADFRYDPVTNDDTIIVTQEVQVANGGWWNDSLWTILKYRDYEKPSASLSVRRGDTDNADSHLVFSASSVSLISFRDGSEVNVLSYKFQVLVEGVWEDRTAFSNVPSLQINGDAVDNLPYLTELSYKLRLVAKDLIYESYAYDTLPTSAIVMTWGKEGAGFGKIWERGTLDVLGEFWKNNHKQPTLFMKKPSDPDIEEMEDGDLLFIYNDLVPFSSTNFPQEFGTGYVWSQQGTWPTQFNYWTSSASTTNSVVESLEASSFVGSNYPSLMFDGNTNWNNGIIIPYGTLPGIQIIKFKGLVQFNSFTLHGWAQGHETKNSPKSFAFFGSNDGHTWISLYDTTTFADTYNNSVTANMINSGLYFKYLKLVWRTNQDNNSGNTTNATMIAFRELTFNASGYRYA